MAGEMQNKVAVYAVLVLAGLLGAASDAVLNQWARTGRGLWLLSGYALWLVVATLLAFILRSGYFGFGAAVVLFLMVNSLAALAVDRFLFHARLSAWGWAGIALAIAAMICIEIGRHQAPGGGG